MPARATVFTDAFPGPGSQNIPDHPGYVPIFRHVYPTP
jgi:hypothetical protein